MKRKQINKEIRKDIVEYWTEDKKILMLKEIRKKIFYHYQLFEELEEKKIQNWAHKMISKIDLTAHADRLDIKRSIRLYMKKETLVHLGLQKYFPELYTEEEKDG